MDQDKKRNSIKKGAVSRNNGLSDNNAEKYNKELNDLHTFLEAMTDSNVLKSVEY